VSKRSRGFQPSSSGTSGSRPDTGTTDTPSTGADGTPAPGHGSTTPPTSTHSPTGPTSRSATRRRAAAASHPTTPTSFLERYRGLLLVGFAVIGIGIVLAIFSQNATAQPYVCDSLMTPGPVDPIPTDRPATPSPAVTASPAPTATPAPTPTPAGSSAPGSSPAASAAPSASPTPAPTPEPQPTQRLGFATADLGRDHVTLNSTVTYGFCPPTSGNHFNTVGLAPLTRRLYGPNDTLRPGNWIHNLEHGYVVIAYKGDPGKDVLAQIQTIMDTVPPSAFSAANCGSDNKVIAVRFDSMSEPFAVLAWDRALLLPTFDAQQISTFAQQWQDSLQRPEAAC
jgi:hypothetical protein